ncbi:hypothetical protein XENORESO_020053 [Xenotaenia resolanae]|uniref:Uncharacterized protein n=1 Tax=Xenotaenia resolanae TaxID=208358 RepID=A0ABV0VRK2_9TELE
MNKTAPSLIHLMVPRLDFFVQGIYFGFWDANYCISKSPTDAKPQVVKVVEQYWAGVEIMTINVISRSLMFWLSDITAANDSPFPLTRVDFPVWSDSTKSFIPHLVGLFFMYCFRAILALVATMRSSREVFRGDGTQLCRLNCHTGAVFCADSHSHLYLFCYH